MPITVLYLNNFCFLYNVLICSLVTLTNLKAILHKCIPLGTDLFNNGLDRCESLLSINIYKVKTALPQHSKHKGYNLLLKVKIQNDKHISVYLINDGADYITENKHKAQTKFSKYILLLRQAVGHIVN